MEAPRPRLFREEALAHRRAQVERSDLLAIDPRATAWGMHVVVLGVLIAVLFLWVGRVDEYASGPAIVRLEGRTSVGAKQAGVVTKVHVLPGSEVEEGEPLIELHAADELAELEAASRELDDQLRKLLQQPEDKLARETLASLRARRDLAETRLALRTVRAPRRGTLGDVRVREGQVVEPGMLLAELHDSESSASVSALLPGRYRPLLARGHKLRFRLDGFQRQVLELSVERVGERIVGPREATRHLGPDLADSFPVTGPVVLVEARLPRESFRVDDGEYQYAHGMLGLAEAVVRSERVIYALFPVLKPGDRALDARGAPIDPSWLEHLRGLLARAF